MAQHHKLEGGILFSLMFFGAILVLASHAYEDQLAHLWASGLGGLGEAFFIAGVLGLLVDRGLKETLAQDALNYLVGWEVPEKLREAVKELIRLPSVRRGFTITYEIEECKDLPGFVRLTSVAEFGVFNLTPRVLDYQFRSRVEHSLFKEVRQANRVNAVLEMWVSETKSGSGTNIIANPSVQPSDATNDLERTATIKIPANGARWFKTKREQYFPNSFFAFLDLLPPACEGITVKVHKSASYTVTVYFGTGDQPKHQVKGEMDVWVNEAVHLPGQHVRIMWQKTNNSVAAKP